jgi:hypothetical protein
MPNVIMSWEQGYKKYGSDLLKTNMGTRYSVYIGLRMTAHEKAQRLIDTLNDAKKQLQGSDTENRNESELDVLITYLEWI